MRKIMCVPIIILGLAAYLLGAGSFATAAPHAASEATHILKATGIEGGLVVHLGCGDGSLTAALRAKDSMLVHGLDTDAKNVAKTRANAAELNLGGAVSASTLASDVLPFIDNVVNLLVAEQPGAVSEKEIMRVLVPYGVAYVKTGGKWAKKTKPYPENIDEWTHFLHGPDGNAVANDSVVGPPKHMQWVSGPKHTKSHRHGTAVDVMVSAKGRLFSIEDRGPTALPHSLPSKWWLIARNAFNGVTLWQRPISQWQTSALDSRNLVPTDLHRRLVVEGERVYTTLSIFGPVEQIDAVSGKTLRTYEGTENAEEIVCQEGVLYLVVNLAGADELDRRAIGSWRTEVLPKRIVAIRAETGEQLWEKRDKETQTLLPMSLAARRTRVFFQNTDGVFSLDALTGKETWRSSQEANYKRPTWSAPTLVALDGLVLTADRRLHDQKKGGNTKAGDPVVAELSALSAESGEALWTMPCAEGDMSPVDVFSVNGSLWVGETIKRNGPEYQSVRDQRTGKVTRKFDEYDGWADWHHHRCYRDKATEKYILAGRTGVEFINLKTGELTPHNWLRGNCKHGVLPCNGLLYMPPDQCGCYVESKLTGFHALASTQAPRAKSSTPRLEKGPAYGKASAPVGSKAGDWPTYRGDAARSGTVAATISPTLKQAWEVQLGGRLSQPVVAEGRLFVAALDNHELHVLDADSGKALWSCQVGGRIDSPPTISNDLAVFGSRDGWVYALRASDGVLAWRFRAAPDDLRLIADDRLESVWPVNGSVLVEDGIVHCAAGRSSYLDGGVNMLKIRLATGDLVQEENFNSRDAKTGRTVPLYEPYKTTPRYQSREMPGVMPDILSSDGKNIWMRAVTFDRNLAIEEEDKPHLFSWMGYLDDSWWERAYWIYGDHCFAGCFGVYEAQSVLPTGRLLVFDDTSVFGYQDQGFLKRTGGIGAFAANKTATFVKSTPAARKKGRKKTKAGASKIACDWRSDVPVHPNGIVLAGQTLFLAGSPAFDEDAMREHLESLPTDDQKPDVMVQDALDAFEGRKGGLLVAIDKSTGKKIGERKLDSIPVFDGLIAANGGLYMSTRAGSVVALSGVK